MQDAPNVSSAAFLWPLLTVLGVLILGVVAIALIRKRAKSTDDSSSAGFSLSDLRTLHKSGQMTDEEYEKARAKIILAAQRAADRDDPQGEQGASGQG